MVVVSPLDVEASTMYTLPVSQCPNCELRFGSPSERDLHLREDHRPPMQRRPEPPAAPVEEADEQATPVSRDANLNAFVVRGIVAAAVLAFVSVLSWQVAMVLTLFLVTGVAGWALRRAES
jgi:hypothetical protein